VLIAENYPAEMRVLIRNRLTKEQSLLWHRILHEKGWDCSALAREYGGPGWSIMRRFIFEQETSRAGRAAAASVSRWSVRSSTLWQRRAEEEVSAAILSGEIGGAKAIRTGFGLRPGVGPHKAVRDGDQYVVTATRPGRRWLNMPTGFSACADRSDRQAQAGISSPDRMKSPASRATIITIDGSHMKSMTCF